MERTQKLAKAAARKMSRTDAILEAPAGEMRPFKEVAAELIQVRDADTMRQSGVRYMAETLSILHHEEPHCHIS